MSGVKEDSRRTMRSRASSILPGGTSRARRLGTKARALAYFMAGASPFSRALEELQEKTRA